jgi:hypothetical protein
MSAAPIILSLIFAAFAALLLAPRSWSLQSSGQGKQDTPKSSARSGPPNEMMENDSEVFAGVTDAVTATAPTSELTIRTVEKLSQATLYTGQFSWNTLKAVKAVEKPIAGRMLVKVILDLYSDKESEILWMDDVVLLDANSKQSAQALNLILQLSEKVCSIGIDGLKIGKGG